jgi:glutamate--cysteine ligase
MAMAICTSTTSEPLTLDSASRYIYETGLSESAVGVVGLELETHLIDLAAVPNRPAWARLKPAIEPAATRLRASAVTVEPGGQVELSGAPAEDVVTAVAAMRYDEQRLRLVLAEHGLGLAHLGADPLRAPRRINPRPRYRAMERHFASTGRGQAGATMMCSTASIQLNLQAGPRSGWADRLALAYQLGPTLVAVSANSRWLNGRDTGWASARQRAWFGLDPRTSGVVAASADPAQDWVDFALAAPVLFTELGSGDTMAVAKAIPFSAWLSGRVRLADRLPTQEDLRTHLSTLFPPVRLRGYLELRYLDVNAPRWWPAIAAVTATLLDDPVAAAAAAEATESTAGSWETAARAGLADPALAESARRCLAIAVDRVPEQLRTAVTDLAELVESGRSPGDLGTERIAEIGVEAFLAEVAHA